MLARFHYRTDEKGEVTELTSEEIIDEHNKAHAGRNRDTLFVTKLIEYGLDNDDIAGVLETMREVCVHCYNDGNDCQCMNDE